MKTESILQAWLRLKIYKKTPCEYLQQRGIKSIAIYGMGPLGYLFCEEAQQNDIKVNYVVDRKNNNWTNGVEYRRLEDMKSDVDAVVICSSNYASEIYDQIIITYGDLFDIYFLDDMILQLLCDCEV